MTDVSHEMTGVFAGLRGPAAALQRAADALALLAGWAAGLCILSLTLLVLTDILLAFFSRFLDFVPSGTGVGWEYSAYLMGAAFLLGSGLTLRAGLMLRVEVVMSASKARGAHVLEIFSSALGCAVTVMLAIWLLKFTLRNYGYGDVSQESFTPLWIPQAVLTLGAAVLAVQMIARFFTALAGNTVNRPDLGAANAIE